MQEFKPGDFVSTKSDIGLACGKIFAGAPGRIVRPGGPCRWFVEFSMIAANVLIREDQLSPSAPKITTPAEDRALAEQAGIDGTHELGGKSFRDLNRDALDKFLSERTEVHPDEQAAVRAATTAKSSVVDPEQALKDAVIAKLGQFISDAAELDKISDGGIQFLKSFGVLCDAYEALRPDEPKAEEVPALLPCPFCGGNATAVSDYLADDQPWRIECDECCCEMEYSSKDAVVTRWNARHSPAKPLPTEQEPTDEAIEKLREWFFGDESRIRVNPQNIARFVRLCFCQLGTFKPLPAEIASETPKKLAVIRQTVAGNRLIVAGIEVRTWTKAATDYEAEDLAGQINRGFAERYGSQFSAPKAEKIRDNDLIPIAEKCGVRRCTSPGKSDWFEIDGKVLDFVRLFARSIEAVSRGEK